MCGRFYLDVTAEDMLAEFGLSALPQLTPHYNIAPSQQIAAIKLEAEARELVWLKWGLIPSWAKDKKFGYRTINARAETVDSKPSFRSAFKHRRCLIPASGFFEWQATSQGKQPYCITSKSGRPFVFAGLYEHWEGPQGEKIDSCTIIVTEARGEIATIHERMPVILSPGNFDAWLDQETRDPAILKPLLLPHENDDIRLFPVSRQINSPKNNAPENIKPI
ncbi:MAG: SOS response-associated peptidase [Candidatus Thiodiazotropha sp.]